MDKKKTHLTNEYLSGLFNSKFELVRHAIKLVENMIATGRDSRVKTDQQNKALIGLEEISEGKDWIDEIIPHGSEKTAYESRPDASAARSAIFKTEKSGSGSILEDEA